MKNSGLISIVQTGLLLLVLSCTETNIEVTDLPDETPIVGIDYPNETIMRFPWSIDIVNNQIMTFSIRGESIIRLYDIHTGKELHHVGHFGGGPNEFVQPEYWGKNENNDIFIYDMGAKQLRKYAWNEICNASDLPEVEKIPLKDKDVFVMSGKYMDANSYIAFSMAGLTQPIIELDKDLKITKNMGNVPDKNHQSSDLSSYNGSTSVYGNKFVFAMASFGYIVCYEKKEDGMIEWIWEKYLEKPQYKNNQLDRTALKLGFSDVKMTKNYIFCSYFGQQYVRENRHNIKVHHILVFDHKGNFLANLYTDRSASRIAVDEDEKTIYAVTEEPEVAFIRFDISHILNHPL